MITSCPRCAKNLNIPDHLSGKRVRCPACGTVFQVPTLAENAEGPSPGAETQSPKQPVQFTVTPEPSDTEAPPVPQPSAGRRATRRRAEDKEGRRGRQLPATSNRLLFIVLSIVGITVLTTALVIFLRPDEAKGKRQAIASALAATERQLAQNHNFENALAGVQDIEKQLSDPVLKRTAVDIQALSQLERSKNDLRQRIYTDKTSALVDRAETSVKSGNTDDASRALDEAEDTSVRFRVTLDNQGRTLQERVVLIRQQVAAVKIHAAVDGQLADAEAQIASGESVPAMAKLEAAEQTCKKFEQELSSDVANTLASRIRSLRGKAAILEATRLVTLAEQSLQKRDLAEAYGHAVMAGTMLSGESVDAKDRGDLELRVEPIRAVATKYRGIESSVNTAVGRGDFASARGVVENALKELNAADSIESVARQLVVELGASLDSREGKAVDAWLQQGGDPGILRTVARRMLVADPSLALKSTDAEIQQGILRFERSGVVIDARYDSRARMQTLMGVRNRVFATNWRRLYYFPAQTFATAIRLAEQLDTAGVPGAQQGVVCVLDGIQNLPGMSCMLVVRQGQQTQVGMFMDSALWELKQPPRPEAQQQQQALLEAAKGLADALDADNLTPVDVRRPLAYILHSLSRPADPRDFLDPKFVIKLLSEDYLRRIVPGVEERLHSQWNAYESALSVADRLQLSAEGRNQAGDTMKLYQSVTGNYYWRRTFTARPDVTAFVTTLPSQGNSSFWVQSEFSGTCEEWPSDRIPDTVRMTHTVEGEVASYETKTGQFVSNSEGWERAAALDDVSVLPEHFRPAQWRVPPHVIILDNKMNTVALVLASGRLDMPNFAGSQATIYKAHDHFVEQVAKVLDAPGALGLFFRYCAQYVLDSPVENTPLLLGSGPYKGEIHQDYHQYLDRFFGGRFLGDCDDLAEFYNVVTRKQGRPSFVLGVPGHATCGWVEDHGEDKGSRRFEMIFVDTGPPRHFFSDALNDVLRRGEASYDETGTMRFDPQSIQFLFRFAGEPVRTPYMLGSRMFIDADYADVLTRVQEMWHFYTYKEGIDTMTEELKKRPVASSFFELAGLYRATEQWKQAAELQKQGIAVLNIADVGSRGSNLLELAIYEWELGTKDKALATVNTVAESLRALESDPEHSSALLGTRIVCAEVYRRIEQPVAAWEVLKTDLKRMAVNKSIPFQILSPLTGIYEDLQELDRSGKLNGPEAKKVVADIEAILADGFGERYFEAKDDFGMQMIKYGILSMYYAAKYGRDRLVSELIKDGSFPAAQRNHLLRNAGSEDADWEWIRLAIGAYGGAIGWLLNQDHPERFDKDTALKLISAGLKAADKAAELGSQTRYDTLAWRVLRASLCSDLSELEGVLKEVKTRNWSEVYKVVVGTMGQAARFVSPDHFRKQAELFARYIPGRPQYFQFAYDAFHAKAYEQAIIAAEMAGAKYPDIKPMQKEMDFLKGLAITHQAAEPSAVKALP